MSNDFQQRTLLDVLAQRMQADPDGPYLDFEGVEVTARQVDEAATHLACALAGLGVKRGDRVATLLENRPEQVESFFGTLKLAAIHQPVNTAYRGEFLRHQLVDAGVKVVIVQGEMASRIQQVAGHETPELVAVIVLDEPDEEITNVTQYHWDKLLDNTFADDVIPDPGDIGPSDLSCLLYTSGTTGPSKGCMLSHNYLVTQADQVSRAFGRRPDDVVFTPLPLFHLSALGVGVIGTLMVGGRASISRRFSVSRFWPEVKRTGATIAGIIGSLATLIAKAEDHPDQVGHSLRECMAVPMLPETDQLWRERFGCMTRGLGYGLSEAALIAIDLPGEDCKPGSSGKINSHEFDVKIFDDHDNEVPVNDVGEIVCQPKVPNVMFSGYFRRPEATLAVLRNLWLHTGDLGRIDEDGYLFFVDRKKDYMRRRGENISSFELEKTFLNHQDIKDVAVHSVLSKIGEDDVKVTAILCDGAKLTEQELAAWAANQLPHFAMPRYIEFREELPRTPTGRVQKYQLRDEGKTATTWDAEAVG
jgi:carnitine-CoA ligase